MTANLLAIRRRHLLEQPANALAEQASQVLSPCNLLLRHVTSAAQPLTEPLIETLGLKHLAKKFF